MVSYASYKGFFTVKGAKMDVLCDLELPTAKDGSVRGQGTFADGAGLCLWRCCVEPLSHWLHLGFASVLPRLRLSFALHLALGLACPPPFFTGTFTLTGSRAKGVISATVTFAAADSESKGPEEPSPLPELTIQTLVDEEHPEVRARMPVWRSGACACVQRCQRVCRMVHVRV